MIETHMENDSFYRIDIARHPNKLANETCHNVGHDFIREEHPKTIHFTKEGSVSTLDFFMKYCNTCGLQQNFSRITEYDAEEIEMFNIFELKSDEALNTKKEVYFEYNIPVQSDIHQIENCLEHDYDIEDVGTILPNGKPTDDSWIKKYKFKLRYKVGTCNNCNHRFCTIIPINKI